MIKCKLKYGMTRSQTGILIWFYSKYKSQPSSYRPISHLWFFFPKFQRLSNEINTSIHYLWMSHNYLTVAGPSWETETSFPFSLFQKTRDHRRWCTPRKCAGSDPVYPLHGGNSDKRSDISVHFTASHDSECFRKIFW